MAFTSAEEKVREIADRIAASSGLEIVEVELRGGAGKGGRLLRVFVEKNEEGRRLLAEKLNGEAELKLPQHVGIDQLAGVTHEDLESFSRELGTILDVEDAVQGGTYTLEVSSPGLDRKLYKPADYKRFHDSLVKFSTRDAVNGNRHYQGRIKSVEGEEVVFTLDSGKKKPGKQKDSGELRVPFENIEKAQLVPEV